MKNFLPPIPKLTDVVENPFPGCFDHESFLELERRSEKQAFFSYARHVRNTINPEKSLVREIAVAIAKHARPYELQQQCVPLALFLSRALEEFGIWCCVIRGSVQVEWMGAPAYYIHVQDTPKFEGAFCGHTWILAPPFDVIDLTMKWQADPPSSSSMEAAKRKIAKDNVPEIVLGESLRQYVPPVEEMMGDSYCVRAGYLEILKVLPATIFRRGSLGLKYIPDYVMIPSEKLNQFKFSLGGMPAFDFFNQVLKPTLSL